MRRYQDVAVRTAYLVCPEADAGGVIDDGRRWVDDALAWTDGAVTYRVESALGRDATIELAESLQ